MKLNCNIVHVIRIENFTWNEWNEKNKVKCVEPKKYGSMVFLEQQKQREVDSIDDVNSITFWVI